LTEWLQITATLVGVVGAIFAGAWALLGKYSSMKERLEEQRDRSLHDAVASIKGSVQELAVVVRKTEERLNAKVEAIEEKVQSLRESERANQTHLESLTATLDRAVRFIFEREAVQESELVQLGKNSLLVRSKKPQDGEP